MEHKINWIRWKCFVDYYRRILRLPDGIAILQTYILRETSPTKNPYLTDQRSVRR